MDCLFCRMVGREAPADVIYEDRDTLVIRDINPQAPTHLLAIPKKHYGAVHEVPPSEAGFFDDLCCHRKAVFSSVNGNAKAGKNIP